MMGDSIRPGAQPCTPTKIKGSGSNLCSVTHVVMLREVAASKRSNRFRDYARNDKSLGA